MSDSIFSQRFATAQTTTTLVTPPTGARLKIKFIGLSTVAAGNAQLFIDSTQIATTESALNMADMYYKGALNGVLKVTSSGAVSVTVVYEIQIQ